MTATGAVFLLTDDVTPATSLAFGPTAAGDTSASQVLHFWFNQGTPGGSAANLSINAVDPATGLDSGVDWLDETWIEARVNGGSNPSADPTFKNLTTDWYRLGNGTVLPLPDLPGNCAYFLELRLHPPLKDGAATESVNFKLISEYSESAFSISGALPDIGQGIVVGVGDRTVTEWVEAPTVLASGTPDALVHVSKRWYVYAGISLRTFAQDDLTLNQNDGASVALTTGHEYKALISQPPGAGTGDVASVVTKGLLAVTGASLTPALPAGNMLIAVVVVPYHVTASVIVQGNITVFANGGRGKPTIGTGLNVNITALRAIVPGARIINRSARVIPVPASTSSWIWLGNADTFTVSSSAVPPFNGALPICSIVAGVSTITTLTDERTFFEPNVRIVKLKSVLVEPRLSPKIRIARKTFPIAAAAFTDCVDPYGYADMQLLGVAAVWRFQPPGTTTANIGTTSSTSLYASAVSTVAGTVSNGLIAGSIYYAAVPTIRVTPNATPSAATGIIELTWIYLDVRPASAFQIDAAAIAYPWNLDRMVASCGASGATATGATTFDVQTLTGGSICPSGARPSIVAPGGTLDAGGYPNVTVGQQGAMALFLSAVTDPGDFDYPSDLEVALFLYPVRMAS